MQATFSKSLGFRFRAVVFNLGVDCVFSRVTRVSDNYIHDYFHFLNFIH